MKTTLNFEFGNRQWTAHTSGALYSKDFDCLLIADVHLGKVSHFRKHGSAVPMAAIRANFAQLNEAIDHFKCNRIYFLGDLFHSHSNKEWDLFAQWIGNKTFNATLILGNHDIIPSSRLESLGITTEQYGYLDNTRLTHIPVENPEEFTISGHIHPGVRLRGSGRQTISLPCFYASGKQLVLPAFGCFTGKHIVRPKKADSIYVIADGEMFSMPQMT